MAIEAGMQDGFPVADLPPLYASTYLASLKSLRLYNFLLGLQLVMIVGAAAVELISQPHGKAIASFLRLRLGALDFLVIHINSDTVTATVAASLVPVILSLIAGASLLLLLSLRPDQRWHRRRVLAIEVARLAWRYCMNAMDLDLSGAANGDSRDDDAYLASYGKLVDSSEQLGLDLPKSNEKPLTEVMRNVRALRDLQRKRDIYLHGRIMHLREFFSARAAKCRARRDLLRLAIAGLYVVGLPIFLLLNGSGFVATAAGAIGTWLSARRYDDLFQIYSAMVRHLEVLEQKTEALDLTGNDAESRWSRLVDEVESLLANDRSLLGSI